MVDFSKHLKEKKHDQLSASSHDRWGTCYGAPAMCEKFPPGESSIYAAEGTVAHIVADTRVKFLLGRDRYELGINEGRKVEQDGFTITISKDMLDAVQAYIDYVVETMIKYNINCEDVFPEEKIALPGIDLDGLPRSGTTDLRMLVRTPGLKTAEGLIIVDYKHGAGVVVDVYGNRQVLNYAAGAYDALSEDDQDYLEWIELSVVQPRGMGHGITTTRVSVNELKEFKEQLLRDIELAKDPNAPRVASDKACRFCPAKLNKKTGEYCPEYYAFTHQDAGDDFKDVEEVASIPYISSERLASILSGEKRLLEWIATCKELAFSRLEAGDAELSKRFHIGPGKSSTSWKVEPSLLVKQLSKIVDREVYVVPEGIRTFPQVRDAIQAEIKAANKAKQDATLLEAKLKAVTKLAETTEGKRSLKEGAKKDKPIEFDID